MLACLRVGLLAEGDSPLDEQGPFSDVYPAQPKCLTRAKSRVRKDGDERRVALTER